MFKRTDTPVYPPALNFAVYARNAIEGFAKELGLESFVMLDDDIKGFSLRYEQAGKLRNRGLVRNITKVFEYILEYIVDSDISCASSSYNNIY